MQANISHQKKIYGITYGDLNYKNSRQRAIDSLSKYTDQTFLFTEEDLSPYIPDYPRILYPGARGGGYWLFKSIFLKQVINSISHGDMIIWIDSGVECLGDLEIFYEIATENNGFCLFKQHHKQSAYTKRDCFFYMGCDTEIYHNTENCDAAIQIYIKNNSTIKFIEDYYHYCKDYRIITDSPNECGLPNLPNFIDHRHDQSILTNLCVRYNVSRFMFATQYRNTVPESVYNELLTDFEKYQSKKYNVTFNHHRNKN